MKRRTIIAILKKHIAIRLQTGYKCLFLSRTLMADRLNTKPKFIDIQQSGLFGKGKRKCESGSHF